MPDGSAHKSEPHSPDLAILDAVKGVARKIDDLGRVVIPSEYRKVLGIKLGDHLDMTLDGAGITLRRIEAACIFCANPNDLQEFRSRPVCGSCRAELAP
jgi:AbrB family transcriptional regulator, transcriptional pleiotropic regulator of transition state genes